LQCQDTTISAHNRLFGAGHIADVAPRADQAPSEKDPTEDPNDSINRENAQLDRMTKGICRGS
jgi:hypothetical protein